MDGNARQQAYDRGHTIFSPDGRLYQVEYARQAVERGSPAVGVRATDGVVLAARKRLASPLLDSGSVEKVHRIDDHIAIASAGHAADARQLVDFARLEAQRHRLRFGEPAPIESVTTALADHVQESTQTGGSRPFGAALLVGGVEVDGSERLYEVDPSGTPYGWRAIGIGDGSATIREAFESTVGTDEPSELPVEDAVGVALDGLVEADDEPNPDAYECLTIEPGPTVTPCTTDRIASLLAESAA